MHSNKIQSAQEYQKWGSQKSNETKKGFHISAPKPASAFANVEQPSVRGKLPITLESRQDYYQKNTVLKVASPPAELHQKPPWDINITVNMTIKLKCEMEKEGGVDPN